MSEQPTFALTTLDQLKESAAAYAAARLQRRRRHADRHVHRRFAPGEGPPHQTGMLRNGREISEETGRSMMWHSMAISMKRIADALERGQRGISTVE